ncbi:hypothetical protein KGF54_004348 [Candida jiufengensis]|uniref:uncharacterized protein n=1 Tax=Candida jiufengensis TaxID=497108 RepID=UPI00222410A4|nr:uncharacterized protein KGF54_004348 [Candida jiufengensis]KAI5951274.1 hypothetical protein KGF54_004348 [Candida jiufengensis]
MSDYGGLGIVIEENEDNKQRQIDLKLKPSNLNMQQQIIPTNSLTSSPLPTPTQQSFHQPKLSISSRHSSNASLSNISISHKSSSQSLNPPILSQQQQQQQTSPKPNLHIQAPPSSSNQIQQIISNDKKEILLPPLPDAAEDLRSPLISNYNTNLHDDQHSTSSVTSNDNQQPSNNDDTSTSQSVYSNDFNQIYQNNKSSISNYALDFPLIDQQSQNNLSYFPTVSKPSNNFHDSFSSLPLGSSTGSIPQISSSINNSQNNSSNSIQTTNEKTSPLKKLKSLKNGIRKLSLGSNSNNSSNSNISTPITPKFSNLSSTLSSTTTNTASLRPNLTPLQFENDNKSSTTTIATPTPIPQPNTINHQHHSSSSSASTSSSLKSILRAKRVRASSQGNNLNGGLIFTPITPPPMTSPIITISENLQSTKTTMNNIEQNYFDSLAAAIATTATTTTTTTTESTSPNKSYTYQPPPTQIEEMTNISDLINYSEFLVNQRSAMDKVFGKTKEKLKNSGWCSTTDLHNLQLQQDSSVCQIDSLLLKIEEKLNRDFNYSFLNKNSRFIGGFDNEQNRDDNDNDDNDDLLDDLKDCISPSLKVLESRCFSFTDF